MSETPEQSISLPVETCIGGTICAGYASLRAWAQDAQKELVSLRARIDELSRAYAVQGLALEEERTRVAELETLLRRALHVIPAEYEDEIAVRVSINKYFNAHQPKG